MQSPIAHIRISWLGEGFLKCWFLALFFIPLNQNNTGRVPPHPTWSLCTLCTCFRWREGLPFQAVSSGLLELQSVVLALTKWPWKMIFTSQVIAGSYHLPGFSTFAMLLSIRITNGMFYFFKIKIREFLYLVQRYSPWTGKICIPYLQHLWFVAQVENHQQ